MKKEASSLRSKEQGKLCVGFKASTLLTSLINRKDTTHACKMGNGAGEKMQNNKAS
jgi:hypothetical protein